MKYHTLIARVLNDFTHIIFFYYFNKYLFLFFFFLKMISLFSFLFLPTCEYSNFQNFTRRLINWFCRMSHRKTTNPIIIVIVTTIIINLKIILKSLIYIWASRMLQIWKNSEILYIKLVFSETVYSKT